MNDAWTKTLSNIEKEISSLSFSTWFKNLEFIDIKDNKLRLLVPHTLYKNHLETNYKSLIIDKYNSFSDIFIEDVNFILSDNLDTVEFKKEEDVELLDNEKEYYVDSNLNKNYTFDTFVVGKANTFAQAAALAVAENPGYTYNPLFIYANSGLGKTHLMHAIGNYIKDVKKMKVLYVTCDQFLTDFTGLVRKNEFDNKMDYTAYFKNKYRNIDVLIVDDIQFLSTAQKSQEEFFHIFNYLYNNNKQIIISSDRSSNDLKMIENRLTTRFYWGLEVNISPPEFELKVEIIKKKIKGERINKEINDEVINYIASTSGNDVRQLEGHLNRVIAYVAIMGFKDITLDVAKEALKDKVGGKSSFANDQKDIRGIQKVVADYYKISFEDIKSKKRSNNIAIPRQVAMYLCRELTDESFPRIGIEFGGKNHTTVIYACRKIEAEMKNDKILKEAIDEIAKQFN